MSWSRRCRRMVVISCGDGYVGTESPVSRSFYCKMYTVIRWVLGKGVPCTLSGRSECGYGGLLFVFE